MTVTAEQLEYHGRQMDPNPINKPLREIAEALVDGNPVVAVLEPGDVTRYRLCIVPCWSDEVYDSLGDVGIPADVADRYLFASKFDSQSGTSWFAPPEIGHYDIPLDNEWSRVLLAWWLRRLWAEIRSA